MRAALPWLGLLLAFLVLRSLAGWPRGVDRDENQNCWNARCLATAGTDFHGNPWPLVLEDYGDEKHAGYAWVLAGLDRVGIAARPENGRLVSTFLLAVGALLFGLAVRVHTGSGRLGLLAAGTIAFLPWFQVGPCLSWETSTSAPGYGAVFLGLALVESGRRRKTGTAVFLAGLAFAVYGYAAPKVIAPLVVAAACLLFWRTWRGRLAVAALAGASLLPMLVALVAAGGHTDRARHILVSSPGLFAENFLAHYLPSFLVWRGDTVPRHHSGFLGVLPVALVAALVWVGWTAVRERRFRPATPLDRFALAALLFFPLPAALTEDGGGHVHRALLGGFVYAWFGVAAVRALAQRHRGLVAPLVVVGALQCAANLAWIRFVWRDAATTAAAFHGTFYGDLRSVVPPARPARVLFSPLPSLAESAFPLIHFAWTAFDSRPVPGRLDPHVPAHLATRGTPEVDVWLGQDPLRAGPDVLVQMDSVPPPPGFRLLGSSSGELRFWIRAAAR